MVQVDNLQYGTTPRMGAYLLIFKRLNFMVTIFTIVLAVVIAVNVWLMIYTAKREKQRRKNYRERMDEFDKQLGDVINQLGLAKQRLNEAIAEVEKIKNIYKSLLAKHEDLKLSYQRVVKERDDVKEKYSALLVKRADLLAEIERLKEDPVDGGEPTVHDQPSEPANKPDTPLRPKNATRSKKRIKK